MRGDHKLFAGMNFMNQGPSPYAWDHRERL